MRTTTDGGAAEQPDPVLVRLRTWAEERGLSRADIARAIGVSRAAVSGWLLELDARGRGACAPRSGRSFRYTQQRPDVQARIARVLGEPIESLRTLSIGLADGAERADDADGPVVLAPDVWAAVQDTLGMIAVRGMSRALGAEEPVGCALRYRIAATAEAVDGVVATLVLAEHRGHGGCRALYQHLVAVFVDPPPAGADLPDYLTDRRAAVDDALTRAGLPVAWADSWSEPDVTVRHRGGTAHCLGALVAPFLAATRPAHRGTLLPVTGEDAPVDTLAVIVGGALSGADVIAGLLAGELGVGHIRDVDLVQRARDSRARRDGSGEGRICLLADWTAALDSGFVIEHGLHLLRTGGVPGAWLMSIQTPAVAEYGPLRRTLVRQPDTLVVVRAAPAWRRFAAWRLAAAHRDRAGEPQVPDAVTDAATATAGQRRAVAAHAADAAVWRDRLDTWEAVLDDIVAQRADDPTRRTISLRLDAPPAGYRWHVIDDGVWRTGTGRPDDRPDVVFPDAADDCADRFAELAADLLCQLADAAGESCPSALLGGFADGPVAHRLDVRRSASRALPTAPRSDVDRPPWPGPLG